MTPQNFNSRFAFIIFGLIIGFYRGYEVGKAGGDMQGAIVPIIGVLAVGYVIVRVVIEVFGKDGN